MGRLASSPDVGRDQSAAKARVHRLSQCWVFLQPEMDCAQSHHSFPSRGHEGPCTRPGRLCSPVFDVIAPQLAGDRLAQARVLAAVLRGRAGRSLQRGRFRVRLARRGRGSVHRRRVGHQAARDASAGEARDRGSRRAEQEDQAECDPPCRRQRSKWRGLPAAFRHSKAKPAMPITSEAAWRACTRRARGAQLGGNRVSWRGPQPTALSSGDRADVLLRQ